MKMLNDLRKAQKDLKKQKVVVAAGGEDDDNPQVEVTINGELKVESVKIDPEQVDLEDIEDLEHNIEIALRDGTAVEAVGQAPAKATAAKVEADAAGKKQ